MDFTIRALSGISGSFQRVMVFFVLLGVVHGVPAMAAEFDPERRALFISILEENDCRMNNFQPVDGILKGIEANGFTRDEVRAIAKDILATGDGVRQGEFMVLKTGSCA
ncbi:MAG: hypothetical protein GY952_12200 [Rhodobacteraceae bacterium]|nr:hypothetical protein [Paracoccaceae bacterium]